MFLNTKKNSTDHNTGLLESKPKEDLYHHYQKLTPLSKIALWSALVCVTAGLIILLRIKKTDNNKTPLKTFGLTLSGGGDVSGILLNASFHAKIIGLNQSIWQPLSTLQIKKVKASYAFQWRSYYTGNMTEGEAIISCEDTQECRINGTGILLKNAQGGYNITFNPNATCYEYRLYMESMNVPSGMACRSQRYTHNYSPRAKIEPYAVYQGEYFNFTFSALNKNYLNIMAKEKEMAADGDVHVDCYSPNGYTMNRIDIYCNNTNFCRITPRLEGYTCTDDMFIWPTTSPCVQMVYVNDCPVNSTNNSTTDDSIDDDLNNTVSLWKNWKQSSITPPSSLFNQVRNVISKEEKKHLRQPTKP